MAIRNGYLTWPASKLSLLLFLSASKCENIKNIPCPTFADIVPAIRALETITFGDEQAATMKTNMTEADLSGKELGASGATIVAAFLPKCQ